MNDSTRLDLLRFLERVQEQDLARTRKWIADEEQRHAAQARTAAASKPPPPEWLIERVVHSDLVLSVHVGDCNMTGKNTTAATRDDAVRTLAEGIEACPFCQPDVALGIED
ncbi:DUF6233 domain-containing protein [Streptomyces sp. KL116D]|uniref:DUF6233 domain-containing protein n=1 Tax=Streptomyces sp. KL116D TaxID=3045152 RepID=UPI0035576CE0